MSGTSGIETSAVAISQKVTAGSGVASFFAFLADVNVIAWGGLLITALSLLIQFYFALAKNRREKAEHELRKAEYKLRIENLKGECDAEQD